MTDWSALHTQSQMARAKLHAVAKRLSAAKSVKTRSDSTRAIVRLDRAYQAAAGLVEEARRRVNNGSSK